MSSRVSVRRSAGVTIAALVTGLLAVLMLSWNVAASAAPYPPSTPPPNVGPSGGHACTVSTTTADAGPGDSVHFVGSGFSPNQSVTLSVPALSAALGSVTTTSSGTFSGTFTWPASVNGKSAVVQASAPSATCSFTLLNSHSGIDNNTGHRTNNTGGLSSTGFQTLTATTIAVALIGAGALFLGLSRRRKKA